MTRVVIVGAGGHGQVVVDILRAMRDAGSPLAAMGYVDDAGALRGATLLGLPVKGEVDELSTIEHDAVIVAVGNNQTRRALFERLRMRGERFVTAIHPAAVVAPSSQIGAGCMLCAGVIVNPGSQIGDAVILNTACSVDHHNKIADYVHIAPGVRLGGNVQVADGSMVGIGAVVLPGVRIGRNATVAAGSVVVRTVEDDCTVAGVPAAPLTRSTRR
jgi:sugar O-acyltransferase (sialic acid O-acetyltransferase NeuD family)